MALINCDCARFSSSLITLTVRSHCLSQGFRGPAGTSTAWPAALTVGATWDRSLARAWGAAMGKEFFDKGANVQLGPGMCITRVPRNGRNFEYISGEDPVLGAELVGPVIEGIQSQGVIANAKHWVQNNQETDRGDVDENVDERTQFELYYQPFEAAAAAGVGSVMCSCACSPPRPHAMSEGQGESARSVAQTHRLEP